MRRTGSSCLLRPRNSLSTEDLQRLAQDPPTATVLTSTRLPSYCSDRDYILSELQVHAHSIQFLCDLQTDRGQHFRRDAETNDADQGAAETPSLPPSIILYLLWKPNTYPTPRSFADGPLSESVRQCLLVNGDSAPEEELERVRANPRSSPYSPRRQSLSPLIQEQLKLKKECMPVFGGIDAENNDDNKSSNFRQPSDSTNESIPVVEDAEQNKGGSSTTPPSSPILNNFNRSNSKNYNNDDDQMTKIYVVVDRIFSSESNEIFPGLGELPNLPDLGCLSHEEGNAQQTNGNNSERSSESEKESQQQSQNQQQQLDDNPGNERQKKEQKQQQLLNQHNQEIQIAEALAKAVASSRFLRNRIDGISVGITSDARAAPGLEACLDAVGIGAKERRQIARRVSWSVKNTRNDRTKTDELQQQEKMTMEMQNGPLIATSSSWDECMSGEMDGEGSFSISKGDDKMRQFLRKQNALQPLRDRSPKCSPIGIVAYQPDDLEGMNHDHHHHHQNHSHHHGNSEHVESEKILQSRICAEWNGKGDFKTFSDRAMIDWRRVWFPAGVEVGFANGISSLEGSGSGWGNLGRRRPKVPRISKNGSEDSHGLDEYDLDEPISNIMVIAFLIGVVAYIWNYYGDYIHSILKGEK